MWISTKKALVNLASILCTVGGALFGLAAAKEQIQKIVALSDMAYRSMLVISIGLIALGAMAFCLSLLISPAQLLLDEGFRQALDRYECVFARVGDLDELYTLYTEFFGADVPSKDLMRSWLSRYRKAFAMIYRLEEVSIRKTVRSLVGSFKVLPITAEAVHQLDRGRLSGATFSLEHIASKLDLAAAYYIGDVVATTKSARGVVLAYLNVACEGALRKSLAIYARPLSRDGKRVMTRNGFVQAGGGCIPPEIGRICRLGPLTASSGGSRRQRTRPRRQISTVSNLQAK